MKLRDYLLEKQIPFRSFAALLGIGAPFFYQIMCGARPIPKKYWKKVHSFTQGKVSYKDLFEDSFKEEKT